MAFYDALNIGVDMALNYSNLVLKSGLPKSTIYFYTWNLMFMKGYVKAERLSSANYKNA